MTWFWDLVILSVQVPFFLPLQVDLVTQLFNGCPPHNLKNLNLHAWLLEPPPFRNNGSLMRWQQELRLLKDYQPELSINQSGPYFVKWCRANKVDFWSPSVTQIAYFLLHLFQDRKLQPSIIEGYGKAIADMVDNDKLNISKDENLTHLLDSFTEISPRASEVYPARISLVLHQLTKAPFEPLRKASLKHLTFKTVFLLALGSGKRHGEIHAWLNKNIRHQEDWSKVSFYPSPIFLSKNQLAREHPSCVAPVVIFSFGPYSIQVSSGEQDTFSSKSLALLFGQNQGLEKKQRSGVCAL